MVTATPGNTSDWWNGTEPERALACMWIGQAGFLIRVGDLRIVIDPYLSDSLAQKYRGTVYPHRRMVEPPISPERLIGTDLVLCTHEHTDHLDPGTLPGICTRSPEARVVVPRFSLARAIQRGVPADRIVALSAFERWDDRTVSVSALPAAHEDVVTDGVGNRKYLGYVVRIGGYTVYHSGDTIPNVELESSLERFPSIDVAFLPCNGRDQTRRSHGVPGNLTAGEAISYHERFGFRHTFLHHFGMFDFNTVDPAGLSDMVRSRGLADSVTVPTAETVYRHTSPYASPADR